MRVPLTVRMLAPVVSVSVLLLGVGLVTAWYVERLQENAAAILVQNVASIRAAEELEIGLRKVRTRVNTFRLTGDRAFLQEIPGLRQHTDRSLEDAVRLGSTEREQELMEKVSRGYERFFAECNKLAELAAESGRDEEQWALVNDVLHEEIVEPAHEYLDINAKLMNKSSEQSQQMASRMVIALVVLGTTGPVAGLLAGFGIARGVSRSIVQLSVPIRDTAGKLTEVVGPITASAGGGFEDLELQLRKLADHVGTVVERLQQSQREVLRAEQLAAVGQLAAGVAHELRNPLMSIKLLGQTAAKQGDNACLRGKDIEVLNVAAARLEKSLQGLLDFARPSKPEKHSFELQCLVEETIALVSGRASRQSVQIEVDTPNEPVELVADRRRIGKFEQTNHGTIFLDEIGDMTPATQAKVLRVLQEQKFERLGGEETIQTDVRIIAATNQNLDKLVAAGRFRRDLFYRLRVFTIELPPLRDRPEDLSLLVNHFIRVFGRELGKSVHSAAPDTMQLLASHAWPGNVRELQSAIKYGLVQTTGDVFTPTCLPAYLRGEAPVRAGKHAEDTDVLRNAVSRFVRDLLQAGEPDIHQQVCSAVERVLFDEALRHVHGNMGTASELLGISRNTLRAKLRALGLAAEKQLVTDSTRDV